MPSLFSLQTESLTSCHSKLLKYTDDYVIGNSYSKCSDQEGLDDNLSRLTASSVDHGLAINKDKYDECLFYFKNTSSDLLFLFLNGEALCREHTVKYIISTLSSQNAGGLRSMNVRKSLLWRIVSACATPLILYYSAIIFPRPLNNDFTSIKNC